jgi:hypothetical protein
MSTVPGVVTFVVADFQSQYPAFASTPTGLLTQYFTMAESFLDNTPHSVVQDLDRRTQLLYLITAHIAFLFGRAAGDDGQNAAIVGQMTSGSEGSVSVAFAASANRSAAFWMMSIYGAMYWQMVLPYRSFRYAPAPRYVCR